MGTVRAKSDDHTEHHLAEEIGVEVKKLLRSELSGMVQPMTRELTEDEQQIFADSYLQSTVEQMIPSPGQERRLMARLEAEGKQSASAHKAEPSRSKSPAPAGKAKPPARKKGAAKSGANEKSGKARQAVRKPEPARKKKADDKKKHQKKRRGKS